jgi:Mg2+ and Co2+ transporter CorA
LHLISASLHRNNFDAIDEEIKAISFKELRDPVMQTEANAKLLTLREALSKLATETADASKYVPSHVKLFYKKIYDKADARDTLDFHSPVERLAAINKQARELEKFLMDSFQLLMSSISVVETQRAADQAKLSMQQAKLSMEQADRTAKLTQLAFVYIPLSFVTSVFGMNIRELSDPVPPIWVCGVTLVVVAMATAAFSNSLRYRPDNLLKDLLKHLLSDRYAQALGLPRTAVPPQGTDATAADVEKGPARSGLASGC